MRASLPARPVAAVFAAALILAAIPSTVPAGELTSLAEAKARAVESGKPILLDFTSST
jgi:hypothetical protein